MSQTTLRDQLSAAFAEAEGSDSVVENEQPSNEVVESSIPETENSVEIESSGSRGRDERGRFKGKEEVNSTPQVSQEIQPEEQKVRSRPSSWKKDYEEDWGRLDPRLQDYLSKREEDYAKGVSMYKQNWEQARPLHDAMAPFMPLLQQHSIDPTTWIKNLGEAHRMLATGSPDEKLQMFAKLANDYGVSLGALTGQQHDPQFSMLTEKLNKLENQWTQYQTSKEQQEKEIVSQEIEKFAQSAPHFEEVRETMSLLLQGGKADDLQSAYDKAIRLHDDLWQEQQATQAKERAEQLALQNQQKVAQAKAKAVSPKSTAPTGMKGSGNGKSLRETLSDQFDEVLSSRY